MKEKLPQELGTVLHALLAHLGIKTKIEQYSALEMWREIVGEQIARVTEIERVEKNVLYVRVSNAPWRTELTFRKQEIIKKIHDCMKSDIIKDIRFR